MADDRIDIGVDLVHALIAAQFPQWADLPVRPVAFDGWDNHTFHLGNTMKVRLPSAARYVPQVEKEQLWLPRLAPLLPLPIPDPIALGKPGAGYPFVWSVYRWLPGETAARERIGDMSRFAVDIARFLRAFQSIPGAGAPATGPQNFYRGGPLAFYDDETRQTIGQLEGRIDTGMALAVWDAALAAEWGGEPVWVHGDIAVGNLLVSRGQLSAVIDFGGCCVGDPACDLVLAWTFLDGASREVFRTTLAADSAMWARARGWALWKALLTLARNGRLNPAENTAKATLDAVLAEHGALA